jgi:hypothetical protein
MRATVQSNETFQHTKVRAEDLAGLMNHLRDRTAQIPWHFNVRYGGNSN